MDKKNMEGGNLVALPEVSFIPSHGLLLVDTCGLNCDSRGKEEPLSMQDKYRKIKGGEEIYNILKERGRVLTTPGCLEEISTGIINLKRSKKGGIRRERKSKRYGGNSIGRSQKPPSFQEEERHLSLDKLITTATRFYDLLKDGTRIYKNHPIQVDPEKAYWLVRKNPDLSEVDKGLVARALSLGDSVGILSSDKELLAAYVRGVRSLELLGCFTSNGYRRQKEIIAWEFGVHQED